MHLIDGKSLAFAIREEVKAEVATLGRPPRLEVMLVGNDPASHLYVDLKRKAGEEAGIRVEVHKYSEETATETLLLELDAWNANPAIDAILVQIPLPASIDENAVTSRLAPRKDADGFHPQHVDALFGGDPTMIPPVHAGILRLISETPLKLAGAQAAIICNSETFSRPLTRLLAIAGASVSIMRPDEIDRMRLQNADLIVTAVGRLKYLTPAMTKDDAVIIDVGTNKTPEGKVAGDVDAEAFAETDVWLSPVPGGVGPMTIAELLKNVVRLAKTSSRAK